MAPATAPDLPVVATPTTSGANPGNPSPLPQLYEGPRTRSCFAVFSVAIMLLILAFFQRFSMSLLAKLLDPMQADAYGMFLVHYPIAAVGAILLFDYARPAIVKVADPIPVDRDVQLRATRALRQIPARRGCCDLVASPVIASEAKQSMVSAARWMIAPSLRSQ